MSSRSSPYFQKELEVFKEAEAILSIRKERIRLQIRYEANRITLSNAFTGNSQQQFFERVTVPEESNHPGAFILCSRESTLAFLKTEQVTLRKKLKHFDGLRKTHLAKLVDLSPETTSMSKADLDFLLRPLPKQKEESRSDSDSDLES